MSLWSMLVLFIFLNGNHGIDKNHMDVELHKDIGFLAEVPESSLSE